MMKLIGSIDFVNMDEAAVQLDWAEAPVLEL